MDLLDSVQTIFLGGLSTALDIEAEKQRAKIQQLPQAEDTPIFVRDDEVMVRKGEPAFTLGSIPPVAWIVGALGLAGIVYLAAAR